MNFFITSSIRRPEALSPLCCTINATYVINYRRAIVLTFIESRPKESVSRNKLIVLRIRKLSALANSAVPVNATRFCLRVENFAANTCVLFLLHQQADRKMCGVAECSPEYNGYCLNGGVCCQTEFTVEPLCMSVSLNRFLLSTTMYFSLSAASY